MSVSDPIADMICVIKNGFKVKKDSITIPYSRIKYDINKIFQKEGFIKKVDKISTDGKDYLKVDLKYNKSGNSVITEIVRKSTPGKRNFVAKKDIPKVNNGFGVSIVSTSKGVISGKQARINNVGGEMLLYIW